MKIHSKALYQYLLDADVLNGTKEAIADAKRNYRTAYKRTWKKQRRPRKEIRFEVTLRQFASIKAKAYSAKMRPATYVKAMVLSSINEPRLHDERLLEILQLISMATIATTQQRHPISQSLRHAELLLLQYLNIP